MIALHRIGVVMAYRGESHMFKLIFAQCFFVREPDNLDDLVARMPEVVTAARATRPENFETDMTLELYVVGWSHSRGRIAGAAYTVDKNGVLTNEYLDSWVCASSPELPGDPNPDIETHELIFEHARKQTRYANTVYAEYATGGHFFVAEITQERIAITDAGRLDD